MKQLSQSLEELAGRVKVLEDSATATFEADRAKLEQRRSEIDEAFKSDIGELESAVRDAAAAGRTWWDDTKASMRRPLDELRGGIEQRKSEHEVKHAVHVADDAEADAAAAIELAAYALNLAEYAVIDAVLARMAADALVGASTAPPAVASS
jgi:hypothetical protein